MIGNLYLFRGLPGSGKSTLAETMAEQMVEAVLLENDTFWNKDGKYVFDKDRHNEAKAWCLNETGLYMKNKIKNILVANTFIAERDINKYIDLARQNDYTCFVMIVENRHNGTNVHEVPDEFMVNFRKNFSISL